MQSNQTLIQKADMALADIAPGGELVPEQVAKFFKVAIKESVMLKQVRAPLMKNPKLEIPRILWTSRVLQPGVSGSALAVAQRSAPSFGKVTLDAKLAKGEVHMPEEILEDQIERGSFKDTLVQFMGERISEDLEDALLNGDTASADAWLAVQDGLIKKIATNVHTPAGAPVALTGDVLNDLMQTLPEQFDAQPGLQFYTNRHARAAYRASVRARETILGDGIFDGSTKKELGYDGIKLTKVPKFPNNLGAGTDETVVLYLDPKNAITGFHRQVRIEQEKRISEGVWAIVVTLRWAIELEYEPAAAKADGIFGQ